MQQSRSISGGEVALCLSIWSSLLIASQSIDRAFDDERCENAHFFGLPTDSYVLDGDSCHTHVTNSRKDVKGNRSETVGMNRQVSLIIPFGLRSGGTANPPFSRGGSTGTVSMEDSTPARCAAIAVTVVRAAAVRKVKGQATVSVLRSADGHGRGAFRSWSGT